jgi:uncharacterized protein
MQVLTPESFTAMPWKNGGGVTHEIAKEERDGRLVWRLSIATVASDGPFSAFHGLARILTVLSGAGLVLRSPEGVMVAEPLRPVRFSGDLPVTGERIAGDVRDLNVIFDARVIAAAVTHTVGPAELATDPGQHLALLCLSGRVLADDVTIPQGAVALGSGTIELATGASGLLVRLTRT